MYFYFSFLDIRDILHESGIMAVCYFLLGNYCDKYLSNYDNIYLNK